MDVHFQRGLFGVFQQSSLSVHKRLELLDVIQDSPDLHPGSRPLSESSMTLPENTVSLSSENRKPALTRPFSILITDALRSYSRFPTLSLKYRSYRLSSGSRGLAGIRANSSSPILTV